MSEIICDKCGRQQPATAELKQCVYCGAVLPAAEVAAATVPEAVPAAPVPPPPPDDEVPEGKRKCTNCGELLYAEEKRCWRCGTELAATVTVAAPPPAASEPPPAEAPLAPPPPLPPDAVVVATPPVPVVPPTPVYVPPAAQAEPVDPAANNLAVWALVLSLLGLLCCPPIIPSVVGIVLGVKARARGVSALGIAALVIGIVGLVVWVPFAVLVLIGVFTTGSAPTTTPGPASWLWPLGAMFA